MRTRKLQKNRKNRSKKNINEIYGGVQKYSALTLFDPFPIIREYTDEDAENRIEEYGRDPNMERESKPHITAITIHTNIGLTQIPDVTVFPNLALLRIVSINIHRPITLGMIDYGRIPANLRAIIIMNTNIISIPDLTRFNDLRSLVIEENNLLKKIGKFPTTLESLHIRKNTELIYVSRFPPNLKELEFSDNIQMKAIPILPKTLVSLVLENFPESGAVYKNIDRDGLTPKKIKNINKKTEKIMEKYVRKFSHPEKFARAIETAGIFAETKMNHTRKRPRGAYSLFELDQETLNEYAQDIENGTKLTWLPYIQRYPSK